MRFPPTTLTGDELTLRYQVREFLAENLPPGTPALGMGTVDHEFSRALAARGWVGMSIPVEYGGSGRTAVDRFVVSEELLAAGAPISAHWTADRQTAPTLLKFGSEELRREFLPAIAKAECGFAIGMSEPGAGSDLASVRTTAVKVDGGWTVNGTKVWTSGAHWADYSIVLCRTSPPETTRHQGLSQLIVNLRADGVTVNPIITLDGRHHFNEVILDDVFVPDRHVVGTIGEGWKQVSNELAYERSGPDRWMTPFVLLREFVDRLDADSPADILAAVGDLTARYRTLRNMSLSVARMIDQGKAPAAEAALVKDLATTFEQDVIDRIRELSDLELDPDSEDTFEELLARAVQRSPILTIRGGTSEILRSVAAKELMR
ncbi:acyl-CoA dehydrogenase family protein [Rhodococcus sp. HM1]|uniref:acyl-CoA dehydrogenase family protein n=1 Tax=unclassified Rhodococcus (in: high G+C Gram-positive bacteria) TaxID=192944 RepID=UPI0018CDFAA9|nr:MULTISPECIES: acyl-CoA dehydrogenase family protein [unclassified Rhodococcus (in: high G+C Gram-positive bacteria)]MBH0121255.1 acyl-CoA dehydrogenase family protein [Rhodococcus sp. CX]MCK8671268.1 acyl-CoA dehydrogenase family protein [Rhodococcus sp. HM1]